MKIALRSEEVLRLTSFPPVGIYFGSLCVLCVGLGVAWYFSGGGWLMEFLQISVAIYLAWTVLEDSEEVVLEPRTDSVSIIRTPPLFIGNKAVVKGKLSEIVSIRMDEQVSQMWGKMTRISLLFESGLRLPLTQAYSTLPQEHIVTAIDEFLEAVAPQPADELYQDLSGDEDKDNGKGDDKKKRQ